MSKAKYVLKQIEPKELDQFVLKNHPEANFLQTSGWGKCYELTNDEVFYFGYFKDGQLIATALTILKPAKRGRYLEIPGGPIIDWEQDSAVVAGMLEQLKLFAAKHKCVFIRMRPNIPDNEKHRELASSVGLVEAPMHLHAEHTVMLDLTKSEDELLADMRRQTRYEVRRAKKLGIEVTRDNSEQAFNDFYDLQLQTAERQGFIPSSRAFILAQQKAFKKNAWIYSAKQGDKLLAQGLIIMQKPEAIYHEAASTLDGRKLPGAYALQWQIMRDAKAAGIKRYNLFGIAPPNSPHHRYAGVTTFKTGFGGEQLAYLPARDLVIKKLHYRFVHALEEVRKKKRHL